MAPILAALLVVAFSTAVCAQIVLPSIVLQTPGNARSIAMGLTGTADNSDPANSWHNPANVHVEGLYFGGAFANYDGDHNRFDFEAAAGSTHRGPHGHWSFGAMLRHARADLREFTGTGNNVKLATHESWMTLVLAAGYGGEHLRVDVGGSFRWSTSEDENETTGDAGLRAGGRMEFGRKLSMRYGLGWSVRNIGMEGVYDPGTSPPQIESIEEQWAGGLIRLGIGRVDSAYVPIELGINADVQTDGDGWGVGTEITVMESVDLRAGHHDNMFPGVDARTFGAGIHHQFGFFFARIDYARLQPSGDASKAHSIGWLFGFDF